VSPRRQGPLPFTLPLMIGWLALVWVALWESFSVANVAGGVLVGWVLVTLFPRAERGAPGAFRPVAVARFVVYFAWKLLEASAIVLWEVVTPSNRINEGVVAIPIKGVSDTLTTLVANAISLTPGTLTIEVHHDPTVLYVHVLHLNDIEAVRREVQYLEVLAIRAFGTKRAVAAAEGLLAAEGPGPGPSGAAGPSTASGPSDQKGQP
jgi:multicomponent Na+:H+ antiporter subunit E